MTNLINRADAIGAWDKLSKRGRTEFDQVLMTLPSAETEWIPVSERLPSENGGEYLVTDYCPQINRRRIRIAYCYANKLGFWSDTPKGYEVIAWMPLPLPYREDGEA